MHMNERLEKMAVLTHMNIYVTILLQRSTPPNLLMALVVLFSCFFNLFVEGLYVRWRHQICLFYFNICHNCFVYIFKHVFVSALSFFGMRFCAQKYRKYYVQIIKT